MPKDMFSQSLLGGGPGGGPGGGGGARSRAAGGGGPLFARLTGGGGGLSVTSLSHDNWWRRNTVSDNTGTGGFPIRRDMALGLSWAS